jgi:hypothetical protein
MGMGRSCWGGARVKKVLFIQIENLDKHTCASLLYFEFESLKYIDDKPTAMPATIRAEHFDDNDKRQRGNNIDPIFSA